MIQISIANKLVGLFPESRCFKLKSYIYRKLCNFDIAHDVRLFSSFKILGVKNIIIGSNTFIGFQSLIMGGSDTCVEIGSNVDISSRVSIITGTHEIDYEGERIAGKGLGKNITIKNGAWIGFGVIIMPGVTIGEKSIVAAGSVVIKDVFPNTMVAGNPAIFKKDLKNDL